VEVEVEGHLLVERLHRGGWQRGSGEAGGAAADGEGNSRGTAASRAAGL
jgi:hypothetical protein